MLAETATRRRAHASAVVSPARTVEFVDARDITLIKRLWTELEPRSDASFFQSWGWIGCWLRTLPPERQILAAIVREGHAVLGLALFGKSRSIRHGVISSLGCHLNEAGDAHHDCLTIEYNGVLAEPAHLSDVVESCLGALVDGAKDWDELFIGGVDARQSAAFTAATRKHHLVQRLLYEKPCHFVDLDAARAKGDYLSLVSANTRHQIRRATKLYEEHGRLVLENARSPEEAFSFLDGLEELHQAYWRTRGHPGSFANPYFVAFHRQLIHDRFAASEIQVARIASANRVIGYLYNFVYRGRVYTYQSGFQYEVDNKRKPGLVSHHLAIEHHLRAGARFYDFLAGDGQHKQSLATNVHSLAWLVAQRKRLKFRIENALRQVKQTFAPQ